ncbi:hypothetical protein L486_03664 [Kwoniella mangroviensis CBS 10435]|uniref:Uncharacterized protein n=1 Tax=Kwoniella mangroviensis CBS 10435 TaxID=1331196 RepID=A0A1B9IUH2_9TREE|nr:hypothetical protein L486_03664 [Kwoniella mangroviensis CBS 10435]
MSSDNEQYDETMRNLAAAMRAQDPSAHSRGSGRAARQRRRDAERRDEQSKQAIYSATKYTHDMKRQTEAERQTNQDAQDAGATNVGAPQNAEDAESWAGDSTTLAGTETPPSEDEDGSNTPLEGSVLSSETGPISEVGSHAGTGATPPYSEDSNTLFEGFAQRHDHGSESGPDAGFLQGPGTHRYNIDGNNYRIGRIADSAQVTRIDHALDGATQINKFFGRPRATAPSGRTAQGRAPANSTTMPHRSTNSRPSEPSAAPDTSFHRVFGQALRSRTEQLLADRGAQQSDRDTYDTEHIGGDAIVQMRTRNGETGVFWGSGDHTADQVPSQPGTATQPRGDTGMTGGSSGPTARGNYRAPEAEEGSDNGA